MNEIFTKLDEIQRSGKCAAMVIVTHTTGSTPRKAGSKMIVDENGQIFGTIGGGNIERKVIAEAVRIAKSSGAERLIFDLENDAEMHCGGSVEVYVEPVKPLQKLVIFGAGHVGAALARYAVDFGYQITLVDNRQEIINKMEERGYTVIHDDFIAAAKQIEGDANTYFVVTTPRHAYDQEVTGILGQKPHRYLGMIGSKKKVAEARKHYLGHGILSESVVQQIDMPIGIPFRAETPEEIAISILARLIDVKNA